MGVTRSGILISLIVAFAVVAAGIAVFLAATTKEKKSSLSDVFVYDVEQFRKTDPALIKYEESDKIETGFQNVFAVAVDSSDRVYVAGDRAIRVFDDKGDTSSEIELADAPGCLAVGNDGRLYIGMGDHVEVYDPIGTLEARWESAGKNAYLTAVSVSEEEIFVADAGDHVVLRYDSSGKLLNRIGVRDVDRNVPGLVVPGPYLDLTVALDGLLRVANPGLHRIEAYTFDGDLEFWWGEASTRIEGFIGCYNPVNFSLLPDGGFVTCEKGLPRVKIYDAKGVFEGVVAGAELFAQTDEGIAPDVATDSRGRIMVLDPVERSVRIFTNIKSIVNSR